MILKWFKKKQLSPCRLEVYLPDGTLISGSKVAWLEASLTEGKQREERLQAALSNRIRELDAKELALRISFEFLVENSSNDSHAGRVAAVIRRVLKGRVNVVGIERATSAKVAAGVSPGNEELGI